MRIAYLLKLRQDLANTLFVLGKLLIDAGVELANIFGHFARHLDFWVLDSQNSTYHILVQCEFTVFIF